MTLTDEESRGKEKGSWGTGLKYRRVSESFGTGILHFFREYGKVIRWMLELGEKSTRPP